MLACMGVTPLLLETAPGQLKAVPTGSSTFLPEKIAKVSRVRYERCVMEVVVIKNTVLQVAQYCDRW